MDRIDDSVRRILELKNTLGLFDDPIPPVSMPSLTDTVGSDQDYDMSLQAALDSITILKNNNMMTIPLPGKDVGIAIGGPTCDSLVSQTGCWTFHWQGAFSNEEFSRGTTILEGINEISTVPVSMLL